MAVLALQISASAADLSDWAVNEYIESNSTGLISYKIASGNLQSNITREEFCELAINLYEKLTNETLRVPDVSPFTDCSNVAVSQAYYNGIVSGVSDDTFEPNRSVTRQEMAKMIVNTLTAGEINVALNTQGGTDDIKSFSDHSSVSDWAQSAISTMVNHNLLSGDIDNKIMPLTNATREQAISCVNRCYKTFATINQDRYMLPIVEAVQSENDTANDIVIKWSPVDDSVGYYILVKDAKGKLAYNAQAVNSESTSLIPSSKLKNGKYSVVVGAIMESGDSVFSVPVDFIKTSREAVAENLKTAEQSTSAPIVDYSKETVSEKAKQIMDEAAKYIGTPYLYGGTTPSGFDCSGFMQYVFRNCGINLNRVSRDQYAKDGVAVEKSELIPGDLVFFGTSGYVSHVGMYVGGGQMIHSPSTGKSIQYTSINSDYYLSHYIGAKRVF